MYNPAHFVEQRPEAIRALLSRCPLATLITSGGAGIEATHLPLLYFPDEAGHGVLRGHMARANPHWTQCRPGCEALAIFHGPQHYISPAWYASKREHGRVVPTWNYVTVHARGALVIRTEPEWLLENVAALTDSQEQGRSPAWSVADAPAGFIDALLGSIVGVELTVNHIEGKWKLSQNRPAADRESVAAALDALDTAEARVMAALVRQA